MSAGQARLSMPGVIHIVCWKESWYFNFRVGDDQCMWPFRETRKRDRLKALTQDSQKTFPIVLSDSLVTIPLLTYRRHSTELPRLKPACIAFHTAPIPSWLCLVRVPQT